MRKLDHGSSVALIYASSTALWLFSVSYSGVLVWRDGAPPADWVVGVLAAGVIAATAAGVKTISGQRKSRGDDMRVAAAAAARIETRGDLFFALCTGLFDSSVGASRSFRELCAGLAETSKFSSSKACREACDNVLTSKKAGTVRARARFYTEAFDRDLRYWVPVTADDGLAEASYFVALITDLPPRWVHDCATERRKAIPLPGLDEGEPKA